ncbi:MAG: DUF4236 domain-containing protein [Salinivirgaceae bacterium]|nr:DUF4236 domain-containing protein [Salinivirgaceae bacterium]
MAGWNFRKRVKIAPGVTLNFSKSGVSTSVGPKGARLSFGPNGTYLNTSIPGTGLYRRQKIGGNSNNNNILSKNTSHKKNEGIGCVWSVLIIIVGALLVESDAEIMAFAIIFIGCIWGLITLIQLVPSTNAVRNQNEQMNLLSEQSDVQKKLESVDFTKEPEKYQILSSYNQCLLILPQIGEAEKILTELKDKKRKKYTNQIPIWEKKKNDLAEGFENSKYSVTDSLSEDLKRKYEELCDSFTSLAGCKKLFERCGYDDNKQIEITTGDFDFIKSDFRTPIIIREDGSQIYFFPTFLINARNSTNFNVIPFRDLHICTKDVTNYEYGLWPLDADVLGYSYQYENKDGSRDLRYSYNPRTTKVRYRSMKFEEIDGFEICASNYKSAVYFETTMQDVMRLNNNPNVSNEILNIDNYQVSEALYNSYRTVINNVVDVANWMKSSNDVKNELNKSHITFNGERLKDNNRLINTLIEIDFLKCFLKLNKQLNFKNSDSFGLLMLFAALNNDLIIEFANIRMFQEKLNVSSLSNVYNELQKSIEQNPEPEGGFLISTLISDIDKKMQFQYLMILHKFSTIVAGIDNIITDEEQSGIDYVIEKISENKPDNKLVTNDSKGKNQAVNDELMVKDKTAKKLRNKAASELQKLIGLQSVKSEVETLTNFIKIQQSRAEKGLKATSVSYHCVFTGNPGTGKTTVARIVANIYKELGVLKKGHLVETDRSGLVAEYVGQTAVKTNKVIDSALDGVLFIDEAYSLVGGGQNDFGIEAISTLLKRMEDDRDRLVVILAGYSNEMQTFINANPGLQSRFNRYIEFPDYSADELAQIFEFNLTKNEYAITEEAKKTLNEYLNKVVATKDERFGNARFVRNLFEKTIERQANRLAQEKQLTAEMLTTIELADLAV